MRRCFSPQRFLRYCANVAESVFYACQQVTKYEYTKPASRLISTLYPEVWVHLFMYGTDRS